MYVHKCLFMFLSLCYCIIRAQIIVVYTFIHITTSTHLPAQPQVTSPSTAPTTAQRMCTCVQCMCVQCTMYSVCSTHVLYAVSGCVLWSGIDSKERTECGSCH